MDSRRERGADRATRRYGAAPTQALADLRKTALGPNPGHWLKLARPYIRNGHISTTDVHTDTTAGEHMLRPSERGDDVALHEDALRRGAVARAAPHDR